MEENKNEASISVSGPSLDMLIFACLNLEDMYPVDILNFLNSKLGNNSVKTSILYAALYRLEKHGYLETKRKKGEKRDKFCLLDKGGGLLAEQANMHLQIISVLQEIYMTNLGGGSAGQFKDD